MVIPTFFVSFNLSAIVGSAILYGDFENVKVHQFTTFLYGCATTFLGVFFLTRSAVETGLRLEEPVISPEDNNSEEGGTDGRPLSPSQPLVLPVLRGKQSSASLVLSPGKVCGFELFWGGVKLTIGSIYYWRRRRRGSEQGASNGLCGVRQLTLPPGQCRDGRCVEK